MDEMLGQAARPAGRADLLLPASGSTPLRAIPACAIDQPPRLLVAEAGGQ
jgi:hypothetical protein